MIKFFRKIRQKLLSENKFSTYIFYAIGEIVLVVIGILIALQINNWNENRQDRKFEITMLKELKSTMESDLESFENFKWRVSFKEEGIQELLKMMATGKSYPDSILLASYNKMIFGNLLDYNSGVYEAIKSIGFDKISNDSLRKELILIYEVDLPHIRRFFERFIYQDSRNKEYKLELHNKLWKRVQIELPDKSYKIVSKPINPEKFLGQPELMDRIKISQDNTSFFKYKMSDFEGLLQRGLDVVNKELNNKLAD